MIRSLYFISIWGLFSALAWASIPGPFLLHALLGLPVAVWICPYPDKRVKP